MNGVAVEHAGDGDVRRLGTRAASGAACTARSVGVATTRRVRTAMTAAATAAKISAAASAIASSPDISPHDAVARAPPVVFWSP